MKKSKVINIEDESLSESDSIEICKKPKQKIIIQDVIIDKQNLKENRHKRKKMHGIKQ